MVNTAADEAALEAVRVAALGQEGLDLSAAGDARQDVDRRSARRRAR